MNLTHCYLLFLGLILTIPAFSQNQTVTLLDEVVLSDISLKRDSRQRQVVVLNDSVIKENEAYLTGLLKFNSPVYFRENGYGMVSSASFRGTSAQQTAVVWNGININSQFTGQTDFNTITTGNFDEVALRPGGGSVLYGSGALGGSVHLNNRFTFDGKFHNRLQLAYGSFNTFSGVYKTGISSEKTSLQLSLSRNSSDNDFGYPGRDQKNENGDFYNTGLSVSVAHRLNTNNTLRFYSNFFDGERAFSGTLSAPSRSKYRDGNSRNLLDWKASWGKFTSSLKLAYLEENYKYFENRNREDFNFGKARTGIVKYDLNYKFSDNLELTAITDFQQTRGEGTNVGENRRNITGLALLLRQGIGNLQYQLSARKEATKNYESPLLFGINTGYQVLPAYEIRLNYSRNFRIPTFNDLYWYAGGNRDLKPETSHQVELGHKIALGKLELDLSAYLIDTKNLLRWVPEASGMWRPENSGEVRNYGLESGLSWKRKMGVHQFQLDANYAYTQSRNQDTQKQLIYVPKHKTTASVAYMMKNFSFFYQFLHNSRVFTSADNNYFLDNYRISNAGMAVFLGKKKRIKTGLQVKNLFNENYMSMPSRPMPGRHFNGSINFKF